MSTAASIANAAADAVNNALKVGSPSKVMIDSGEYTGDGFAIGMKNRVPDIRIAAQAMTRPVIDESQRMRAMDVPVNYRSGIIPETVDRFSGNESSTTNNEDFSNTKITYSPTFVFQGGTPDEDTVVRANKRGQDDFEKRMEEWIRKHKRISFA